MPKLWSLKYSELRCDDRVLIALPSDMKRDIRLLARAHEVSTSEIIRRAATKLLAEELRKAPHVAESFRGKLV